MGTQDAAKGRDGKRRGHTPRTRDLTAKNNSLTVKEKQTRSWAKRVSIGNKENKDLACKKKHHINLNATWSLSEERRC